MLPPEVVSLVHFTELNKVGWWNKSIQHLIESVIWLSGCPLSDRDISSSLQNNLHVDVETTRLSSQIDQLLRTGVLIRLPNKDLNLTETARKRLDEAMEQTEALAKRVKARFVQILSGVCPDLNSDKEWQTFNTKFIQPLIREIGARTYELISGSNLSFESTTRFSEYLLNYAAEHHQGLRNLVVQFLNPKDPDVRSFVLRHLNAYFCLEAGSLKQGTIDSLMRLVEHPPSFRIFVDTNFLFSFLELHENPSNEAAKSLVKLTRQLAGKATCRFYVSPETLDEFKRVVRAQQDFLQGLILPSNLADVALEIDLSGVAQKFVEFAHAARQKISPETYFSPYLTDLIPTLRSKNVELFNDSMAGYSTRQDVVDDILAQLEWEHSRFKERAKNYTQLRHDVVLWHFVTDKRPARIESPVEATFWIVTVDYHYLSFDQFKRGQSHSLIPVCLHPTSLIQMLQFWLPRTEEFEEAVLDSLRLPLLFQEFDPAAERVTVKIFETLARFENVEQLPKEVVANIVVNEALRQQLVGEPDVEKQVQLIKDALVEENQKTHSILRASQEDRTRLETELTKSRKEVEELNSRLATQTDEITRLATDRQAHEQNKTTATHPNMARESSSRASEPRELFYFIGASLLGLGFISVALVLIIFLLRPALGIWRVSLLALTIAILVWLLTVEYVGKRNPTINAWEPFKRIVEVRAWVFGVLILVIVWRIIELEGSTIADLLKTSFPNLRR